MGQHQACRMLLVPTPTPLALPQREELEADSERLRGEFEQLVAMQQERAAEWEAAVKEEEAGMAARKQARGWCWADAGCISWLAQYAGHGCTHVLPCDLHMQPPLFLAGAERAGPAAGPPH